MPGLTAPEITDLLLRCLIDAASIFVLARLVYYPLHRRKEYLFTFILFNSLIFLICLLLASSQLGMGFAFGLFAVFSMIRYRTVTIPVKEMGYFFACVSLSLINALVASDGYWLLLLLPNAAIILLAVLLDKFVMLRGEQMKELVYERIELVKPQRRPELLSDLKERTGLPVHRVEVMQLDFLRDVAILHIYFYSR